MNPRPGEIWLADLGLAAKTHLVAVVSRFDDDAPRALVVSVPLTTQNRESRYEIRLPKLTFLNSASVANIQGIGSVPTVRLERRIGKLPENILAEIRRPSRSLSISPVPVNS